MRPFSSFVASLSLCAGLLAAGSAQAEVLPPDPLAFPSSGVQHPSKITVPKSLPAAGVLDYKQNIENYYGNSNWGGGYRVYEHARAPAASYQSINFFYNAHGRLFGKELEGFRLNGATWNPQNDFRASRMTVAAAGSDLFYDYKENKAQYGSTKVSWNRTPIDKSLANSKKTFTLGPIPVTVSGDLRAKLGVNVTTTAYRNSATASGVSLTGTASATLYGKLSAGVGIYFASAGVSGQVTFAEVSANKTVKIDRTAAKRVDYNNNFAFNIKSLNGKLDVYAEAFGARYDKKILDWNGFNINIPVAGDKGYVTF